MIYYGRCKTCGAVIRKNGLSSYDMRLHIMQHHPEKYELLKEMETKIEELKKERDKLFDQLYVIQDKEEYETSKKEQ